MLSLLRTGRWIAFTAAAILAIVAFGLLSLWQWHRAEEKRTEFGTVAAAMAADPVPVAEAAAGTEPADWQRVTAVGTYDPDAQFLVRNKPQGGSNGFWVVTLLRTEPDDLWVVRGFMPATGAASSATQAPAPPTGEVSVTAYAHASETAPARPADDLPAGQVTGVNVVDLDRLAGTSALPWYVISTGETGLSPIPLPEPTDSRNLSYAGQWLLFAAIAIGGWWYFLRREAADTAAAARTADADPGDARVDVRS